MIKLDGISLYEWAQKNPVNEEMYWRAPAERQFGFYRDVIAPVLVGWHSYNRDIDGKYLRDDRKSDPDLVVIATHRSKSIELPVVRIRGCAGNLVAVMRDNFYDHSMTFFSSVPLRVDHHGLLSGKISCGFEGFKEQLIKKEYTDGCTEFSAQIAGKYEAWAVCYLVRASVAEQLNLNLDAKPKNYAW